MKLTDEQLEFAATLLAERSARDQAWINLINTGLKNESTTQKPVAEAPNPRLSLVV